MGNLSGCAGIGTFLPRSLLPFFPSSLILSPIFNLPTMRRTPKVSRSERRSFISENTLHVSTLRETVVCPFCQLKQFERGNGKCRRCSHSLGITYLEIQLPNSLASVSTQTEAAIRKEVGGLIRRLRSRRDITQSALASLTGIHRTYLSRA